MTRDEEAYAAGQRAADDIDIDELLKRWGPIDPPPVEPTRVWLDALAPLLIIGALCAIALCVAQIIAPTP